jgi:hypothetical protein
VHLAGILFIVVIADARKHEPETTVNFIFFRVSIQNQNTE